ncbi:MAG: cytidine deaminase [Clostridia bacterium]
MENDNLIKLAVEAKKNARAVNTGYKVGAALLAGNNIYTGCNVEHSIADLGCCAERIAMFKAISEGENTFEKIAVVGGFGDKVDSTLSPCGACRQYILDFNKDMKIVFLKNGEIVEKTLKEMMTDIFDLEEKKK